MYTCRTCKLLKKSNRIYSDDGSVYHLEASCLGEALGEWHCPYYFWNMVPDKGFGCKHWINKNGKNWI